MGNSQHETSIAINTTGGGEAHVFRVTPRTLCTRGALSALWEAEPPRVGPREASHLDPGAAASTETTADADSQVSCYARSLPHFPAYYGCCLSTFCALLGTKLWNTTPPSLGHKESHQWISNVWHIKSTRPLTAAPTTDMSAPFLPCLQSRHLEAVSALGKHRSRFQCSHTPPREEPVCSPGECRAPPRRLLCLQLPNSQGVFRSRHKGWLPRAAVQHHPSPREARGSLHRRDKRELQCPRYVLETLQPLGGR